VTKRKTQGRRGEEVAVEQAEKAGAGPGFRETEARIVPNWTSYVGAVEGVLKAAGMCRLDTSRVMGLTQMAFHLIVHEECCPSSVTVYDWCHEHVTALDRLGVLSEVYQAMPGTATYDAARRRAVGNIKASIDRGVGVILWGVDTGEFGVVHGYDDADGVFLVSGVHGGHDGSNPILYENVGLTFEGAPILHYQVPLEKVDYDPAPAYRASLEYYVKHMESPYHFVPAYKAGLGAYENWIRALESGRYVPFGVRYITAVYACAKQHAADYVRFLAEEWKELPSLGGAADAFGKVAGVYSRMRDVLGIEAGGPADLTSPVDPEQAAAMVRLLREARELEARTVELVKRAL